jgi:hypothetical protein
MNKDFSVRHIDELQIRYKYAKAALEHFEAQVAVQRKAEALTVELWHTLDMDFIRKKHYIINNLIVDITPNILETGQNAIYFTGKGNMFITALWLFGVVLAIRGLYKAFINFLIS